MYLRKQVPISLRLFQRLQLVAQDFKAHGSHCRILWLDGPPQVRQNSVCRPDAVEACMSSFGLQAKVDCRGWCLATAADVDSKLVLACCMLICIGCQVNVQLCQQTNDTRRANASQELENEG